VTISSNNESCSSLIQFEKEILLETPTNIFLYGFDGIQLHSMTALFSPEGVLVEVHREVQDHILEYCKPLNFSFPLGMPWKQFLEDKNISLGINGQSWVVNFTESSCDLSLADSRLQLKIEINEQFILYGRNISSKCGMYKKMFMSREAEKFIHTLEEFICDNLNITYEGSFPNCGTLGIPDEIPCELKSSLIYVSIGLAIVLFLWVILTIGLIIFFWRRRQKQTLGNKYIPLKVIMSDI